MFFVVFLQLIVVLYKKGGESMFGDNLKSSRLRKGLSQKKLSELIYVSQQAIWKWESNISTPNPEMILKLAEVLDTTSAKLLGENKKDNHPADISDEVKNLATRVSGLAPEDQAAVLKYIDFLKSQRNK